MASKRIRPFVRKLYEILQNESFAPIIEWHGEDSFIIHSRERLCAEVLRKFFKTSSFDSFTRQLNKYDFRKQRNEDIFWNKDFVRNSQTRLCKVAVKETFSTLRQARENTLAVSLFNCKVVKALTRVTEILEKLMTGRRRSEPIKVLIFEDFEPVEVAEALEHKGRVVDVVFFYNDFEEKISSVEYDYLVIDFELYEIFEKISSINSVRAGVRVICTTRRTIDAPSGVFKLLSKPYDAQQVCALIKRYDSIGS